MPDSWRLKCVLCSNLSEEHERVVGSEVLGEELHTVTLQGRDGVLLSRIQSRHHSLWTNVDLIRIQEPVQRQQNNTCSQVFMLYNSDKWSHHILDRQTWKKGSRLIVSGVAKEKMFLQNRKGWASNLRLKSDLHEYETLSESRGQMSGQIYNLMHLISIIPTILDCICLFVCFCLSPIPSQLFI